MSAEVILFPSAQVNRLSLERQWIDAMAATLADNWPGYIPLELSEMWVHYIGNFRRENPLCQPGAVPWAELWDSFKRMPEVRFMARITNPEGAA